MASYIFAKGVPFVAVKPKIDNPNIKELEFPEEALPLVDEYRNDGQVGAFTLFNAYHRLRMMIMPPKIGGTR